MDSSNKLDLGELLLIFTIFIKRIIDSITDSIWNL